MYRMFDANQEALRERINLWLTQQPVEFEVAIEVCECWIKDLLMRNLALHHLHDLASLSTEMSLADRLVSANLGKLGLAFDWLATSEEGQGPAESALIGYALAVAGGRAYAINGPAKLNWISRFIWSNSDLYWEDFADSAAKTFCINSNALNRFTEFLGDTVARANNAEDGVIEFHTRGLSLASMLEKFKHPECIQDIWDGDSHSIILSEGDAFEIFRRVNPDDFIKIIDQLPHPTLVSNCLHSRALQASLQDLLILLRSANLVVNADGKVNPNGKAAILLLRLASELLLREHSNKADIKNFDQEIEVFKIKVKEILEILFARADGSALAWCWLEKLAREMPELTKTNSSQKNITAINYIGILVVEISSRLEPQSTPNWVEGVKPLNRQYRLAAAMAVAAYSKAPAVDLGGVAKDLLKKEVYLYSPVDQLCKPMASFRMIMGDALTRIPGIADWYKNNWSELRLEREKSWRANDSFNANPAQIMAVLGLGVIEALHNQSQHNDACQMWLALEMVLREATLTEPSSYPPFWSQATAALFRWWPKIFIEYDCLTVNTIDVVESSRELGKLLLPYAKINREFMEIIVGLEQTGMAATLLKTATNQANQDLLNMIRRFKEVARGINDSQAFNPAWVASLKKLEVKLANSLTCNTVPNK